MSGRLESNSPRVMACERCKVEVKRLYKVLHPTKDGEIRMCHSCKQKHLEWMAWLKAHDYDPRARAEEAVRKFQSKLSILDILIWGEHRVTAKPKERKYYIIETKKIVTEASP